MNIKYNYNKLLLLCAAVITLAFTEPELKHKFYTPNGTEVEVKRDTRQFTTEQINAQIKEFQKIYPKAIIIDEWTNDYNCHHYAWHLYPGNTEKWWMDNMLPYITDGSYTRVNSNDSEATHLVYFGRGPEHSAIKSSRPNYVYSKWGALPLMYHPIEDCPYPTSDIRYYKLTMKIDGPTEVKSNMITPIRYTLLNAPEGATITWSVTPKANLLSGQGTTSITVRPDFSLEISAQTSIKGSKVNIPSVHTTCSQTFQITDINLFRYGQREYDFTLMAVCDVDAELKCAWSCDDPGVEFYDVEYPDDAAFASGIGRFTAVRFPGDGTYNISVYAEPVGNTSLGVSHVFTKSISVSRTMQAVKPPLATE